MTECRFTDAATIAGTRKTQDGYLLADLRCARTGIQVYSGDEVGLVGRDTVRVWRPEDAVFDKDSLATFAHKPVTVGHPDRVTADNWKQHAVGDIGDEVARDGEFVRVSLKLMDANAIKSVEDGTREVSMGYTCALEFTDGETPEGDAYDAIQRNIKINHLAIVPRGRAGSECRIGDSADNWGAAPITLSDKKEDKMSGALKTVVLGDKAAQVAVADAQIIEQFKSDQAKALTDAQAAHDKAIAAKDAEIEKMQAKLDAANEKVLDDAALDKRVADRADLIGKAKAIHKDAKTDGLSDAAIRKAVVSAKLGDKAVADKSDAYIEARFDVLAEDAEKGDAFAVALRNGVTAADHSVADKAYAESLADLSTAYQKGNKEEAA